MKKLLCVICVVFFLMGVTVAPVLAKTVWNANSVYPPKNNHSLALADFAEKVKRATNGDLEIIAYPGGALGFKGPELLKAVRDGVVPLSDMSFSYTAGDEKLWQLTTLPFLVRNYDELRILFDIARPYFDEITQKKWSQKILYTAPWPGAGLWTKKKISALEDFKGLRTRTYDKNGSLVIGAVGATPFALTWSEVYTSLQTGLIDSVMTSTPSAVDGRFWEVLQYYEPLNITISTNMTDVNLKSFRKLPKAQQDVLVKIGKEIEEGMWENVKTWDKDMEAICNKNGIETIRPTEKFIGDLEKITANIRSEWLETAPADAREIVNEFLKRVKR